MLVFFCLNRNHLGHDLTNIVKRKKYKVYFGTFEILKCSQWSAVGVIKVSLENRWPKTK